MRFQRKAVSEVVAALMLLAVTIAAFGFYYSYYVNSLGSSGKSVAQGIQASAQKAAELMSMVDYCTYGNAVTLYLYNYGTQPITPQQYFIVVGSSITPVSGTLTSVSTGLPITTIQPQTLAKLKLSYNAPPVGVFYVDIVDVLGKDFEFQLSQASQNCG